MRRFGLLSGKKIMQVLQSTVSLDGDVVYFDDFICDYAPKLNSVIPNRPCYSYVSN